MSTATTPKFKGIQVELGNVSYVVPPLPLGALEVFQDRMSTFTGGMDPESIRFTIDVAHASLKRNYPDLTRDDVAELIDVGNMQEILDAVLDVSGLKRKAAEAAAAGKAPA